MELRAISQHLRALMTTHARPCPHPRSLPRPRASLSAAVGPHWPAHAQTRPASILASISDVPSAYHKKIRRGRGASSGKGKTSGRGHKGQKQHGKVPAGFEGGQTSLEVVKGKRGFENMLHLEMSPLNVDRLQSWIDQRRLDPARVITVKELVESRCLHGVKDGVKLLARGASILRTPVQLLVSRASSSAIAAVEAAGGRITTRYYTKASIRRILRGQSIADDPSPAGYAPFTAPDTAPAPALPLPSDSLTPFSTYTTYYPSAAVATAHKTRRLFRLPDPTSRKDIEYYRDPAHRGYLSHLVREGESVSLLHLPTRKERNVRRRRAAAAAAANAAANADPDAVAGGGAAVATLLPVEERLW
ncbi:MAG: YmL10 [Phylliscum demangeonii]|nr:MAG: YmL10 [Phylliscum demangeonii]